MFGKFFFFSHFDFIALPFKNTVFYRPQKRIAENKRNARNVLSRQNADFQLAAVQRIAKIIVCVMYDRVRIHARQYSGLADNKEYAGSKE